MGRLSNCRCVQMVTAINNRARFAATGRDVTEWRSVCVWSVCVQVGGLGARGRRALVVVVLSWHRSTNKRRFMTFSQPTDAHASRRSSLLISAICTKAPFTLRVRVRIRADTRGTSVVIANSLEAMTRRSHYAWTRGSARSVNGS